MTPTMKLRILRKVVRAGYAVTAGTGSHKSIVHPPVYEDTLQQWFSGGASGDDADIYGEWRDVPVEADQ